MLLRERERAENIRSIISGKEERSVNASPRLPKGGLRCKGGDSRG